MSDLPFQILLVGDDDPDHPTWLGALEAEGFQVATAPSGAAALQLLIKGPVDLVLLETVLPDTSGIALLESIREIYSPTKLPVIMVTHGMESDDIVRIFDLGANDYISKPVDFPVLLVRILARLRGRRPVAAHRTDDLNRDSLEIEPGTVLEGKYRLGPLIGRGHYGVVYQAMQLNLERQVAVKLLHPNYENREESLERFRREGFSACRIEHPNAVAVLDYSVTGDGRPFLVMELLEGHSLEEEIRREGTLTPLRCAVVLLPICEVLAEAHMLGIIHRDIKPPNIFFHQHSRRGETVKVLDFGIAKLVDDAVLCQELTFEGSGPGTPTYMAPERFSDGPYDGRADVYSLGVMLYEMLAGEPPFIAARGNPIKLALMHMSQPPPPLCERNPELPRPLENVVMRALGKDPRDRPRATELAREFVQALGLEPPDRFVESSPRHS